MADSSESPRQAVKVRQPIETFLTPGLNNRTKAAQELARFRPKLSRNTGQGVGGGAMGYHPNNQGSSCSSPPDSKDCESTRRVEHSPLANVSPITAEHNISSIMQSEAVGSSPMLASNSGGSSSRMSSTQINNSLGAAGDSQQTPARAARDSLKTPVGGLNFSGDDSINYKMRRRSLEKQEMPGSEDEEDDRPSCTYKYIGSSGKRGVNRSKNDSGLHTTIKTKSIIGDMSDESDSTSQSASRPSTTWGRFLVPLALAVLIAALCLGGGRLGETDTPQPLSSEGWIKLRKEFRSDLADLKTSFPNQTKSTFRNIFTAIAAGMQVEPEHPGVLMLLSGPSARSTTTCLLDNILKLIKPTFGQKKMSDGSPDNIFVSGKEFFTQKGKADFHDILEEKLSGHGVVAIQGLERLSGNTALVLHGFTDDSVAPFKRSAILMVLNASSDQEDPASCDVDSQAENLLKEYWADLDQDKVSALISRVTASVVKVEPETQHVIDLACPRNI